MPFSRFGANRFGTAIFCCAMLLVMTSLRLFAQSHSPQLSQSELARQNMEHVAASAGQLFAILHKDPGVLVELKRWIAKDATEHGQLISDADLTEEAIFDRLENDVTFRSVATTLVQKYGYLKPTGDPESPYGKEQALLIQERAKWLAQEEEEERTAARQRQKALDQAQLCNLQPADCPIPQASTNARTPQQASPLQTVPSQVPGMQPQPGTPVQPYTAPQQTPQANSITELMQSGGVDQSAALGQLQMGSGASSYGMEGSQSTTPYPGLPQSGSASRTSGGMAGGSLFG